MTRTLVIGLSAALAALAPSGRATAADKPAAGSLLVREELDEHFLGHYARSIQPELDANGKPKPSV
jgi:hypothetical protein